MTAAPPKKLTLLARNLRKQDSLAERLWWNRLRDRRFSAYKFRRQHTFGDYILDFFCVEREDCSPPLSKTCDWICRERIRKPQNAQFLFPLPEGEGQGEG